MSFESAALLAEIASSTLPFLRLSSLTRSDARKLPACGCRTPALVLGKHLNIDFQIALTGATQSFCRLRSESISVFLISAACSVQRRAFTAARAHSD